MEQTQLFKRGNVAYAIYDGCIAPLQITSVLHTDGSIVYGYNHNEFLELMKHARKEGMVERLIPNIKKGTLFYQEDLFISYDHMEDAAKDIQMCIDICNKAYKEYKD